MNGSPHPRDLPQARFGEGGGRDHARRRGRWRGVHLSVGRMQRLRLRESTQLIPGIVFSGRAAIRCDHAIASTWVAAD